jgi:hypothetical protein
LPDDDRDQKYLISQHGLHLRAALASNKQLCCCAAADVQEQGKLLAHAAKSKVRGVAE